MKGDKRPLECGWLPAPLGGHGRVRPLCRWLHAKLVKDGGRGWAVCDDFGDLVAAPRHAGREGDREVLASGRKRWEKRGRPKGSPGGVVGPLGAEGGPAPPTAPTGTPAAGSVR